MEGPGALAFGQEARAGMTASDGPAIEVRGLSKAYARTQVLRGLDLEVPWGQVLTVLGPNGSGKTTLVRILAGLARPDEGSVRVAGVDLAREPERVRRRVGVVTHDALLYDGMTGYENLAFFGRMFGLDRIDDRIGEVSGLLGIAGRLRQRAGTLSHGFRKRFSIARALLHGPAVLVMDEPESGLDQEALQLLDAAVGGGPDPTRSVLVTTHDLERGLAVGDSLVVLSRGEIVYSRRAASPDAADEVREAYFRHTGARP